MNLARRKFFRLAAGAAAVPAVARTARSQAQDFPARPVRIITHSAPGGSPDALLRIVADRLSQMWGRQVLALNHPGAGGAVAARTPGRCRARRLHALHARLVRVRDAARPSSQLAA